MNETLHYPAPSPITPASRNRKDWGFRSFLQLWKNQEVFIPQGRTWSGLWLEGHADSPSDGDLQMRIRHFHKGSG